MDSLCIYCCHQNSQNLPINVNELQYSYMFNIQDKKSDLALENMFLSEIFHKLVNKVIDCITWDTNLGVFFIVCYNLHCSNLTGKLVIFKLQFIARN